MRLLAWSLGIVLPLVVLWVVGFYMVFDTESKGWIDVGPEQMPVGSPMVRRWVHPTLHSWVPGYGINIADWPVRIWWPLCRGWAKWKGWG